MKGSLVIIGFFILGIICGITGIIPADALKGDVSLYALCALMFCVGVSIGNDPGSISSFKQLPRRLTLLPIATILGTWAALAQWDQGAPSWGDENSRRLPAITDPHRL